jgi:hypothetical protein
MKINASIQSAAVAFIAMALPVHAGHEVVASKNPVAPEAQYEGGRGLLTIEGPSGLFINPTSGTLPAHAFTAQYCFFMPNNESSPVVWHGAMVAYGVTDWFEVGALFSAFDFDQRNFRISDLAGAGPLARVRLLKQDGFIPQVSVGGYMRFGGIESYSAFIALYERFEIDPNGFLRSIGLHAGLRETWVQKGLTERSDAPVGYFGLEFQLPYRFYLVGEISTQTRTP